MDLLKQMLDKEPEKRLSSFDAMKHPAFDMVLSKSPLIIRKTFDANDLLKHQNITNE